MRPLSRVFVILYGLYDPEAAGLREHLRKVTTELNVLTADADTLERILEDTVFASRAHLEVQRQQTEQELAQTRQANLNLAEELTDTATVALRSQISEAEAGLARISDAAAAEAGRARGAVASPCRVLCGAAVCRVV